MRGKNAADKPAETAAGYNLSSINEEPKTGYNIASRDRPTAGASTNGTVATAQIVQEQPTSFGSVPRKRGNESTLNFNEQQPPGASNLKQDDFDFNPASRRGNNARVIEKEQPKEDKWGWNDNNNAQPNQPTKTLVQPAAAPLSALDTPFTSVPSNNE